MLSIVSKLFFINRIRNLCGLSMKVEVLAHWLLCSGTWLYSTKCCIIEVIISFVEVVTETIIGIIKINSKEPNM